MGFGLGRKAKIVKSYNSGPKGVFGPGDLKGCGSGQTLQDGLLGINVIKEAQYVIYFTNVVKLRKPKTSGPIIFAHAYHMPYINAHNLSL